MAWGWGPPRHILSLEIEMRSLFMACLFLVASVAGAQACHRDSVSTSPGLLLFLASGQEFKVFPTSNRIARAWLPREGVLVCHKSGTAYEITNLDRKGERIEALYMNN